MMKLRKSRRLFIGAVVIVCCAAIVFISAWLLGAGKAVHQANRLISAEPKETTVNQNSPADTGKEFDHTVFDRLLSVYVDENGWVDYANLKRERPQLDSYLGGLATAEPRSFSSDQERLAFWIDAYNAFTLGDVLDSVYGKVKSVQAVDGFFDKRRHKVTGASLTLDEIEDRCRSFGDPRVHFALVCASTSCPKLQRFAFTGAALNDQLDRAARDFVADSARGLRLNRERNEILLSSLFKWYAGDFTMASSKTGRAVALAKAYVSGLEVLSYVRKYAPADVSIYIDEKKPSVRYLDYDWTLNARDFHSPESRYGRTPSNTDAAPKAPRPSTANSTGPTQHKVAAMAAITAPPTARHFSFISTSRLKIRSPPLLLNHIADI